MERNNESSFDINSAFTELTKAQFNELLSTLERFFAEKPLSIFDVVKKIITRELSLKQVESIGKLRMKDVNRINMISRIENQEDTIKVISRVSFVCKTSESTSEAIQNFIQLSKKGRWLTHKQSRLGILGIKIGMRQKPSW